MQMHPVKLYPSKALLKREDQLAWKIAGVAADKVAVQKDVQEMIINRIIDNASVAIASVNRKPVVSAREMALGHPRKGGATIFGVPGAKRFRPARRARDAQSRRNLLTETRPSGGRCRFAGSPCP